MSNFASEFTPISISTAKDKISSIDKFILFIGRPSCPYCQLFEPKLSNVARNSNLTIFYINSENSEYEQYLDKEIYGIDIASLINKSTDKNEKNSVSKDDKGYFIQNDENSIEIEIYIKDSDTTYKMEQIYKQGVEQFVQFFLNDKFKSSKVEYHEKTKRIKYILFEQI